jgi:hypothetical protein
MIRSHRFATAPRTAPQATSSPTPLHASLPGERAALPCSLGAARDA